MTLAVAVAAAASACGAVKELTAAQKIHDAFGKVGTGHAATFEFQVKATADQLLALDAQDTSSDSKLTKAEAQQVAGLGITVSLSSDKVLDEALKGGSLGSDKIDPSLNMDVAVHTGSGATLAEIRAVSGKEYIRLDFAAISKIAADGPSAAGGLAGLQDMSNELPPSMASLKALLQGKWVSIDPADFANLSKSLGSSGASASPSPVPSLDAAQQKKLQAALADILEKDAHLTDKGTKDGLDTIEIKADNTRTLLTDVQKQVLPLLKDLPGFPADALTSAPTDAPTAPLVATVQIDKDSGTLSSVSFDAGQLDTGHPDAHLPLVLGFKDTAAKVAVPAGAVAFDPNSFKDLLGGLGN